MAPQVRLELTTLRLTAECSAIELLRNIFSFSLPLCYSLMFESGKNFRSSRSPLDPGNFLLSQAVPSSVPSAFGGLTSVFGMGTGGSLQLSSPETFSLPLRPLRLHSRFCFAPSLTLAQAFRLRSASTRFPRFRFALSPHLQNCTGSRVDQLVKHSSLSFFSRSSPRPISIAKLHTLPCFHRRPIYLIVSEGSYLL